MQNVGSFPPWSGLLSHNILPQSGLFLIWMQQFAKNYNYYCTLSFNHLELCIIFWYFHKSWFVIAHVIAVLSQFSLLLFSWRQYNKTCTACSVQAQISLSWSLPILKTWPLQIRHPGVVSQPPCEWVTVETLIKSCSLINATTTVGVRALWADLTGN